MTVEEIIEELLEKVNNNENLSVKDLVDILENISIEDRIANKDALTVFYTGESERLINALVKTADESVRVIRRTDAYKFLADENFEEILEHAVKCDNPNLSENELIKEVNRLLYEASYYDESGNFIEGEGFWTVISRRFAAATTGDAYSLCCNGKPDRIFFSDELRTWLNAVSDDKRMCGFTKSELLAMNKDEIPNTSILNNAKASDITGRTAGEALGKITGGIITAFKGLVSVIFGYLALDSGLYHQKNGMPSMGQGWLGQGRS